MNYLMFLFAWSLRLSTSQSSGEEDFEFAEDSFSSDSFNLSEAEDDESWSLVVPTIVDDFLFLESNRDSPSLDSETIINPGVLPSPEGAPANRETVTEAWPPTGGEAGAVVIVKQPTALKQEPFVLAPTVVEPPVAHPVPVAPVVSLPEPMRPSRLAPEPLPAWFLESFPSERPSTLRRRRRTTSDYD